MEFTDPVDVEDIEDLPSVHPKPEAKPIVKEDFKSGKWTPLEHELFLEALTIHGKDWELIEKHIGTRDAKNIRSHAQKFRKMLGRLIENKKSKLKLSLEEANFYLGVLNSRYHKTFDQGEEHLRAKELLEQKQKAESSALIQEDI